MSIFRFMEYAKYHPANRNYIGTTKEVISLPFNKTNRFKEYWRGMFLYETETPKEDGKLFGNFYIECDVEEFNQNKEVMLDVCGYLFTTYRIPYTYMSFFMTNRSLWLEIPARVFACYGKKNLHLIYKKMATEVQVYLNQQGYLKGIDLSIYKWNGLIHSLGSYLPKVNRWVTKFSYGDLEESTTREALSQVKFDNFSDYRDVTPVDAAVGWLRRAADSFYGGSGSSTPSSISSKERECMKRLEETGIEENRNIHIYAYSLYLKEQGYNYPSAVDKIQQIFDNPYVHTRECLRTIQSAIRGGKHFSCTRSREVLNPDLYKQGSCSCHVQEERETFIVPRSFIELLNKNRVHYLGYKYLLLTLHAWQSQRKNYKLNISGEKYKKRVVAHFEKLQSLGLVSYAVKEDIITASLVWKEKKEYRSHIVIPNTFIQQSLFKKGKKELKVLLELWRSSLNKEKAMFFNVKLETLAKKLGMSLLLIKRCLGLLKKRRLLFTNQLFVLSGVAAYKRKVKEWVQRIKNSTKRMGTSVAKMGTSFKDSLSLKPIMKCIYSVVELLSPKVNTDTC